MKIKLVDIFRICTSTAFLSALFAGAVSCAEEPLAMPDEGRAWAVAVEAETCASTRVSLDGLKMTWDKEDKLAFQVSTENNEYAAAELSIYDVDAGLSRAKFKGEVTLAAAPVECAFAYPVAAASYSDGQILFDYGAQDGSHSPYLYGYSLYNEAGMEVAMHHVGSMLRITNSIGNLSEITLKSNNGEKLSAILCNAETGTASLSEAATDNFTVTPVSTTFGSEIYIAVPPVNLSKGFTLICKTTDNSVMYKSYSSDGTSSAGYDFSLPENRGRLYPISLGAFEQHTVDLTVSTSSHYTSDGYLDGTSVVISALKSGVTNKIITNVHAELISGTQQVVRTFETLSLDGSSITSSDVTYIPTGDYILKVYYTIHGVEYVAEKSVHVEPTFEVEIYGYTSYTQYLANYINEEGDGDGNGVIDLPANGCDNETVYSIGSKLKISSDLLSEYLGSYKCTYTGDNTYQTSTSAEISIGNKTSQVWSTSHQIVVTGSFDGVPFNATRSVPITGLPYRKDFRTDSDKTDWSLPGTTAYSDGEGYRLYYAYHNSNGTNAFSPSFRVPDSQTINIAYDVNIYAGTTLHNAKTYTIYSGITTNEVVIKSISMSVTENTYIGVSSYDNNIMGSSASIVDQNRVSISHDANLGWQGSEHYIFLAAFNMIYSN